MSHTDVKLSSCIVIYVYVIFAHYSWNHRMYKMLILRSDFSQQIDFFISLNHVVFPEEEKNSYPHDKCFLSQRLCVCIGKGEKPIGSMACTSQQRQGECFFQGCTLQIRQINLSIWTNTFGNLWQICCGGNGAKPVGSMACTSEQRRLFLAKVRIAAISVSVGRTAILLLPIVPIKNVKLAESSGLYLFQCFCSCQY